MASSPFEPIKINLVEEKVWKEKFEGDNFNASDAAWEDFSHMHVNDLESLIDDLWDAKDTKKRVSKKRLTSEELEFLAERLKDGDDRLDAVKQDITDAMTWMYEAAAQPSDGDIEEAMEKASEETVEENTLSEDVWEPVLSNDIRRGPKEWSPRKRYTSEDILKQLMGQVSYERKKGYYDRYLVFDFWDAKITQEIFSRYKGSPEAYESLKSEFQWLRIGYVLDVLKHLDKIMKDVDISNRTDWNESWRSMLKSGVESDVREGIREVLKEMPETQEEASNA